MKVTNVLMALTASAMLMTGCMSQKDPAENAVTQAEAAMTDLRVDAAKFAPDELKTTETTLAKMKDNLAKEDYKDVIAEVPQFNKEVATLREVLVGRADADHRGHPRVGNLERRSAEGSRGDPGARRFARLIAQAAQGSGQA